MCAIPAHQEGRSYVVPDRGPGCGGRGSVGHETLRAGRDEPREPVTACGRTALTVRLASMSPAGVHTAGESCGEQDELAYGKTVWSWPSLLRSSLAEALPSQPVRLRRQSAGDGDKRNSSPGRARHKPSTHCAGKAGRFRLHLYAAVQFPDASRAQRTAGASRHPVFPAPSCRKRGEEMRQSSGETRREIASVCVGERCRAEAYVQYVARPPDRSKTAPVENEHSSEASQATSAATSSGRPARPSGIFASTFR